MCSAHALTSERSVASSGADRRYKEGDAPRVQGEVVSSLGSPSRWTTVTALMCGCDPRPQWQLGICGAILPGILVMLCPDGRARVCHLGRRGLMYSATRKSRPLISPVALDTCPPTSCQDHHRRSARVLGCIFASGLLGLVKSFGRTFSGIDDCFGNFPVHAGRYLVGQLRQPRGGSEQHMTASVAIALQGLVKEKGQRG